MTFLREFKYAFRSLARARGLTFTVILTLALGIGGNAAIFTLVRGVLLRPLVNRDESRLIYIRQSAPGLGVENAAFSVPEILDLKSRVTALSAIGDFSTIGFTMIGLGEPRTVRAGVVGGSYFSVMGLSPVLGRLLGPGDDGPSAPGAAVLTWRFWTTDLHSDPSVLGKTIRLGTRSATIVGVLEPCVPYPAETEIIANVVTSPHHLSATMVQGRVHRMTELFGRLAPGATVDSALADLRTAYASMVQQHPEAYDPKGASRIDATLLRDQISSKARTVLLVLLAASGLLFIIACSNVANLVLARSMRREGELAVRQALGASRGALRRTLLAESLLLCGTGAAVGLLIARPMVAILSRYAARFSVRALDLTFDPAMIWAAAGLAMLASVLLAFVPRLPSGASAGGVGRGTGSPRVTGGSNRRLQVFAVTQIAASFILLVGATMLLKTLISLQNVETGLDTRHVLVLNVPIMSYGRTPDQVVNFYSEAVRRVRGLPGVDQVALGTQAPWRDSGTFGPGFEFSVDGYVPAPGEQKPRAQFRIVSPSFFAALGARVIAGRDFNDLDRTSGESVVILSQSLARRLFPKGEAVNHSLAWTDPVMKFIDIESRPRRIVGVVADVDDEHVVPGPSYTVYNPFGKEMTFASRMFVHVHGDPYGLVAPIQRLMRGMSAEQPVERAATLEDIRAEVLTPDRLNTVVFGVFAAVALAIALVGVAGVLAFSVSARMREFGIRLAVGSDPRRLVAGVIQKGFVIAALGLLVGAGTGYLLARVAGSYLPVVSVPGAVPIAGAALVLLAAAIIASWVPARRAGRVDVIQVLRSE
jgi:predicted permease